MLSIIEGVEKSDNHQPVERTSAEPLDHRSRRRGHIYLASNHPAQQQLSLAGQQAPNHSLTWRPNHSPIVRLLHSSLARSLHCALTLADRNCRKVTLKFIAMAMHARDLMGVLLLMLVVTEGTRKYMTIQDLARMQAEAERLTNMFELNQLASRRLLAPPAMRTTDLPLLCQSPGMDCLPGEEVRCEMGRHEGCDCEYIRSCFPRASQCTFFNATHVRTCGF